MTTYHSTYYYYLNLNTCNILQKRINDEVHSRYLYSIHYIQQIVTYFPRFLFFTYILKCIFIKTSVLYIIMYYYIITFRMLFLHNLFN